MIKFSTTFLLLLTSSILLSQFSIFEKNRKLGIKYNETLLSKAKFDSISIADDQIVTAYKNKKTFYFNALGTKIFKHPISRAKAFHNEFAIIQDKKGRFGAINNDGELIINFNSINQPIYYGNLLFQEGDNKNCLYNSKEMISNKVDSIQWLHQWILIYKWKKVRQTYTKKHFLKKDEQIVEYVKKSYQTLYNPYSKTKLEDNIKEVKDIGDFIVSKRTNDTESIRSLNKHFYEDNIHQINIINSDYLSFNSASKNKLIDRKKATPIIVGNYVNYIFNENSIYAIKKERNLKRTKDEILNITIYDKEGQLLKDHLKLVKKISKNRRIFMKDSLQFIGTESGEQLSEYYFAFGEEKNGYRITYSENGYSYINDNTYSKLNITSPLILLEYSSRVRKRKGFFRTLTQDIGNFGRRFIGKPKVGTAYHGTGSKSLKLIESGYPFENGLVKVCLYKRNADSVIIVKTRSNLRYNYVDSLGQLINNKKYTVALPYDSEQAWVKEGKYFNLINNKGKIIKKTQFTKIEINEVGIYKVKYRGKWGVVDKNLDYLLKCNYQILNYKDGSYTTKLEGEEQEVLKLND